MKLGVRQKIELLLAGFVLFVGFVSISSNLLLRNRQVRATAEGDIQRASAAWVSLLASRSAALEERLRSISSATSVASSVARRHRSGIGEPMGPELSATELHSVWITDAAAKRVAGEGLSIEPDRLGQIQTAVASALHGNPQTGTVWVGDRLYLFVAAPLRSGSSILGSATELENIDLSVVTDVAKGLGVDLAIIHSGRVASSSIPIDKPIAAGGSDVIDSSSEGSRFIGLFEPFPNSVASAQTGIVTLRSYGATVAPYRDMKLFLLAILGFVFLLGIVISRAVSGKLNVLVGGLIQAATTIKEGEWPTPFLVDRDDEVGLLQSAFNDMAASVRASQDKLLSMINTDPLTGLCNHRGFISKMDEEATRCLATHSCLSLALIDLDHFADINSKLGHAEGDEALKLFAAELLVAAPGEATISRFGGDSFGILLPGHDLDAAESFALAILNDLKLGRFAYDLSASIGCAQFGLSTGKSTGLLLSAELALGRAKQLGMSQVCRFDTVPGTDESDDPYHVHRYLEDGTFATIQALATAVDAKDTYTRGHSQRVAEYARDLAAFLGMDSDEVDAIYRAGTLHDVGKIGVPDKILKKTMPLDSDERATMQTHPVLGELIVKKAPQLERLLPGVRSHHERWDGQGYPDGLAGTDIPLMARILAVADTFDAMTSDRPYRKGLEFDAALDEIAIAAGTQFETRIAVAFLEMMSHARDGSVAA